MKRNILIILIFLLINNFVNAQKKKVKFGKVSKEELTMKYYEPDSSVNAVVLYDKGKTYFQFDNNIQSFKYFFERHVRIKIFKKDGFNQSNFEIPLYQSGTSKEEIGNIKGKTFNLVEGDITKTKLDKKSIFKEETSKNWRTVKVAFPAVKEGSIIDFVYTISSEFLWNLQSWQFQYKIPVAYSEYSAIIPEFFNYHRTQKGYDNINLTEESEMRTENFTIQWKSLPKSGGQVDKGSYKIDSKSTFWKWKAHTIPAFTDEAYMTTYKDFISILNFELNYTKSIDGIVHSYTNSWDDISTKLIESEHFGKQFKENKNIKEQSSIVCQGLSTKKEKMDAIYKYVQNNFKWNTYNSIYTSEKLSKILKEKKGNSSDINLLLMSMLRVQSICSNPVILSTRAHGKVFPTHPTITAFNYVIIEAKIGDNAYYLDATSDITPIGLIPKRCLNGYGRQIFSGKSEEVKIEAIGKDTKIIMYSAEISVDGNINAKVSEMHKGYAGVNYRNRIINSGGKEDYIKKVNENSSSEEYSEIKIDNIEEIDKPLKFSYNISTSDNIIFAGDMIYLLPLLNEKISENPFKLEDRQYPVDYAYPISKKIIMQYIIPEGYVIDEIPKSTRFSLPEKSAQFQYSISVVGNKIQVISNFKINKTVFQYDSYKALRHFYNLVIAKQKEQIIFKKKA